MSNWPMTAEQEAEMRERARRIFMHNPIQNLNAAVFILQSFVFQGGRLSESVARETCYRIAQEERLPAGYELQEDDDTFYVIYQGHTTGYDFASVGAARVFIWKRYNEGRVPMKSEETI